MSHGGFKHNSRLLLLPFLWCSGQRRRHRSHCMYTVGRSPRDIYIGRWKQLPGILTQQPIRAFGGAGPHVISHVVGWHQRKHVRACLRFAEKVKTRFNESFVDDYDPKTGLFFFFNPDNINLVLSWNVIHSNTAYIYTVYTVLLEFTYNDLLLNNIIHRSWYQVCAWVSKHYKIIP